MCFDRLLVFNFPHTGRKKDERPVGKWVKRNACGAGRGEVAAFRQANICGKCMKFCLIDKTEVLIFNF